MGGKRGFGLNVGSSTILVVFVLLCLTTFATLSLVSANADYKLTGKAALAAGRYYEADARAEERLAELDEGLRRLYETSADAEEYWIRCMEDIPAAYGDVSSYPLEPGVSRLSFTVPIEGGQELQVELDAVYPRSPGGGRYALERWQVVNPAAADEEVEEETLSGLWSGVGDFFAQFAG